MFFYVVLQQCVVLLLFKTLNRCINKISQPAVYWSAVRWSDVGGSAVDRLRDWFR